MRAKKKLGQHFLIDESVLQEIVYSIKTHCSSDFPLLEVGPGRGALTYKLLDDYKDFKAIEVDLDMVELLKFRLRPDQLIHDDFLISDAATLFNQKPFNLVGNFPYNISSQIIFKILGNKQLIPTMVGMFQKEVADRICASPVGKANGIISILTQAFYDAELLFDIGPECFNPPPRVNSSIIVLKRNKTLNLGCDEQLFKRVVKQAFQQRRKKMRNTLKSFDIDQENDIFQKRPEELGVDDFVTIVKSIQEKNYKS